MTTTTKNPGKGQNGPRIARLAFADMGAKEQRLMTELAAADLPLHLGDLASLCWPTTAKVKANSWARNALRRPVRAQLVKRVADGLYVATAKGRRVAKEVM